MSNAGEAAAAQGAGQTMAGPSSAASVPASRPDPLIRQQHGHVGKPVSRIDGPLKARGAAPFAAEIVVNRLAHAALAFSTIAKGRITSLDTGAAEAAPGVVLVMTHDNAPRMAPMPLFLTSEMALGGDDVPVLQDACIRWNGQPIALVLAETQEQADHAASLIRATYAEEPAVTTLAGAVARGTKPGQYIGKPLKADVGDADAALGASAHRVDQRYETQRQNHNAIEPHAATVLWDGDRLVVHDATQAVTHTAWSLAQVFGIKQDQVHVTSPYVGGGFGGKTLWSHQVLGAAAAKLADRPVRINLSREAVYRLVGGRSPTQQRVAIGADTNGTFTAIVHQGVTPQSPYSALPEPFITATMTAYAAEAFALDVQVAELDMVANTFMRGPGESVGTFGLECAVDELADAMQLDPIELRRRNEPDKDPLQGTPWSNRNIVEAYRQGAERFGWSARKPAGTRREGDWLVGLGCATGTYPYNRMPGGAARLTLTREGRASVAIAAHEMGMGTATAHVMIVADRLGLPLGSVTMAYGDSALPGVVLAGGSQQTACIGAAVMAAREALVSELLKLAGNDSPLAGLSADEVEGRDGGLCKVGDPSRRESYASILARAQRDEVSVVADAPAPAETKQWSMHSWGALFCEARVHAVTGELRIARFLGSYDVGSVVNAKTAASQLRGGIIMGLGLAMMEETQFDSRSGRIMNPSLAEYHVPVHLDVPPIEIIWTGIPDPHAPMGAHGVGEIGITGTAAAVANAVYNATGKRVRNLPITLDKLL